MTPIQRLDRVVVDQIAAGEVVERPASVVKELVENALDAGADRVEVALLEGGCRRIEVRDNGGGIPKDELELAVTSHATSKLRASEDLDSVATLGFRGEALASIAAVSRLELISRPRDADTAASLRVEFGRLTPPRDASGPPGTRIVVEDLFLELPARRKFLKTVPTELSHAAGWVERLLLAHPGVGFTLTHEGRTLLEVSPQDGLEERCGAVFGKGLSERMLAIREDGEKIRLEALLGPPDAARRSAARVHLFVNGRWVRDPALLRAVRQGMGEYVPHGHYPTLYLAVAVPPDRVDVNVHPQKTEVRFRDSRLVVGTVVRALQRGLAGAPWASRRVGSVGLTREAEGAAASASAGSSRGGFPSSSSVWERPLSSAQRADLLPPGMGGGAEAELEGVVADGGTVAARGERSDPFTVGAFLAIANTYLVREVPGGMEIIDQHALHERVNLEELRNEVRRGSVTAQPLLAPIPVEVSREELSLLLERREVLRALGVELEAFGETTVALHAVPARLGRVQPEALVRDLLEIAGEQRAASPETLQEEALHSMACRGAVMAGDRLDAEALRDLLKRGAHLPQDRTCAHGRPVRVFLSHADLERAFHRR